MPCEGLLFYFSKIVPEILCLSERVGKSSKIMQNKQGQLPSRSYYTHYKVERKPLWEVFFGKLETDIQKVENVIIKQVVVWSAYLLQWL